MHVASGWPAPTHELPWMQSKSVAHGCAHLPYCVLHLCVPHCESLEHGKAIGPGTAS